MVSRGPARTGSGVPPATRRRRDLFGHGVSGAFREQRILTDAEVPPTFVIPAKAGIQAYRGRGSPDVLLPNELNSGGKLCDLLIGDSQWVGGSAEHGH